MKALAAAGLLAASAIAVSAAPRGARVNDLAITQTTLPATLAEYGFFADPAAQKPASGVTPYRVTTPLWSDGSEKLRFIYIPKGAKARAQGDGLLGLPLGTALIKTFKLEGRLIETRVLLHRSDGWLALPYQWNAEQTEARLVLGGKRLALVNPAGERISYAIPNKNQCKECHAMSGAVVPLGPKARNLPREWLAAWHAAGRIDKVPVVGRPVPRWEDRAKVPLEDAARGYLDANCAHCHNPAGSASNSGLDLRWEQRDPVSYGVLKRPTAAGRGSGGLEFDILPGDPDRSILVYRMESLEGGISMPEIGRSSHDREGEDVIRAWIKEMKR